MEKAVEPGWRDKARNWSPNTVKKPGYLWIVSEAWESKCTSEEKKAHWHKGHKNVDKRNSDRRGVIGPRPVNDEGMDGRIRELLRTLREEEQAFEPGSNNSLIRLQENKRIFAILAYCSLFPYSCTAPSWETHWQKFDQDTISSCKEVTGEWEITWTQLFMKVCNKCCNRLCVCVCVHLSTLMAWSLGEPQFLSYLAKKLVLLKLLNSLLVPNFSVKSVLSLCYLWEYLGKKQRKKGLCILPGSCEQRRIIWLWELKYE